MPGGTATPTIANNPVFVGYTGSGLQFALNLPFIPSHCHFAAGTLQWSWYAGMGFGDAILATGSFVITPNTGCVLDTLDGSSVASTNVGTTTAVMGLLIGTNTIINNGGAPVYRGLVYR